MATVKCYYCEQQVEKTEAVKYKKMNYHPKCCELKMAKDELCDYICKLYGLKRPGPTINSQIANLLQTYPSFTYKGLKEALVYYHEVLKNPVKDKYRNTIGIVTRIYSDAQNYFDNLDKKQDKVLNQLKSQNINVNVSINNNITIVKKHQSKGKKFINMNELEVK